MIDKNKAINNLDTLINKVEFTRLQVSDHHIVQVIAVSKYSTTDEIKTLYDAGQRAFGENKIQDLKQKATILENIQYHGIL